MSKIPASIEVGAQHVHSGKLEAGMLPTGTRVYITDVGVDPERDRARGFRVTDNGITLVTPDHFGQSLHRVR